MRSPPLSHAVISVSFTLKRATAILEGGPGKPPWCTYRAVHSSSTDLSSPAVMHLHIWAEVTEECSGGEGQWFLWWKLAKTVCYEFFRNPRERPGLCTHVRTCQCSKVTLGHTEEPQCNLLLKDRQKDGGMTQHTEEERTRLKSHERPRQGDSTTDALQ